MRNDGILLGVDLGTSGLKLAAVDPSGEILAQSYRSAADLPRPPGQAEQDPNQWWQSLCSATGEVLEQDGIEAASILAVGVCGFHHCPVFLDADGRPARPSVLLHDDRLPASRAELAAAGVLAEVESISRSMVSAAHFPPIFHFVKTHDGEALGRTRWILLAKDYLRYRLTGEIGTEICDATGTNLVSAGEACWSPRLCELLGVEPELLPPIGRADEIAGEVTGVAARETGLPEGTPVVYGGGDSHCALLGLGCVDNGDTGMLLGTNSTLRTVFDRFVSHPRLRLWVQHHVVPDRYSVSASSMAGASVLSWFQRVILPAVAEADREAALARLEAVAKELPIGSDGVVFLPYIHGERAPFYDPEACGGFFGLRKRHRSEHLLRSVFEGVVANIGNCFELIADCARQHETNIEEVRLAGGGSGSGLWYGMIADCLARPLRVMGTQEVGTLGAALLAGVGAGVYSDARAAAGASAKVRETFEPDPANHQRYLELREKLNRIYQETR